MSNWIRSHPRGMSCQQSHLILYHALLASASASLPLDLPLGSKSTSRCVRVVFDSGRRFPRCEHESFIQHRAEFSVEAKTLAQTGELVEDAEFIIVVAVILIIFCMIIYMCCSFSGIAQGLLNQLLMGDLIAHDRMQANWNRIVGENRFGGTKSGADADRAVSKAPTPLPDEGKMVTQKWMVIYDVGMNSAKYVAFDSEEEAFMAFRNNDTLSGAASKILFDPDLNEQRCFGNAFVLDKFRCLSRKGTRKAETGKWAVSVHRKDLPANSVEYFSFEKSQDAEKFAKKFVIYPNQLLEPVGAGHQPAESRKRWWERR